MKKGQKASGAMRKRLLANLEKARKARAAKRKAEAKAVVAPVREQRENGHADDQIVGAAVMNLVSMIARAEVQLALQRAFVQNPAFAEADKR